MRRTGVGVLVAVAIAATVVASTSQAAHRLGTAATVGTGAVTWMPGSTTVDCGVTGQDSAQESQIENTAGLVAGDQGNPFAYQGKLWFLFGDAVPTRDFPPGTMNDNQAGRFPYDTTSLVNDAIAYAPLGGPPGSFNPGAPPAGDCPSLTFVPNQSGAYANPSLTLNGHPVSLRTNNAPIAGIGIGARMYVLFTTGNTKGLQGYPTTSILAVPASDPTRSLAFNGLYTFSAPTNRAKDNAKFVFVAFAPSADGRLYVFGTEGGDHHRHSLVYLARVSPAQLGTPGAVRYFEGLSHGKPKWSAPGRGKNREASAAPLFADHPACAGDLGVRYSSLFGLWELLYTCNDNAAGHLPGIWLRFAPNPWGPWSAPQTVFNAVRDRMFCYYIYKVSGCPAGAPDPGRSSTKNGADYGAHFVPGWSVTTSSNTELAETFYYVVATFNPYGEMIVQSTVQQPRSIRINPPPCKTHCV